MSLRALYDLAAPAKINLFLHVVGRRADGYHLLESVFVLIDWTDTLHIERRNDGQLVRHDLGPALPADDLCLRAARALQQASATALGADISILKRVPWGAGMGGGSSDAATTLLALNHLWGLHWPRRQLARIGLDTGSRCALLPARAACAGTGHRRAADTDVASTHAVGSSQAAGGDPHARHLRTPAAQTRRANCYSFRLS
jgi:4-diphosphocytidyl-2C-methyl-D-erythritol kinase